MRRALSSTRASTSLSKPETRSQSLVSRTNNRCRNFIYSKEFFWFGCDAVESKHLSSYLKTEKSAETAHHNAAWAAHTGKGLLFFGDKTAPQGIINLVRMPGAFLLNMVN